MSEFQIDLLWILGLSLLWLATLPLQRKYPHPGVMFPRREKVEQ